jgi:catechol 2,3-dioxygenase-like lactoylglutathione lyase family enzyme
VHREVILTERHLWRLPASKSGASRDSPQDWPSPRRCATRRCNLDGVDEEVVPVLYVEDAPRAVAWYERLGFSKEWEHQFEPGLPWFVSVARGRARLYLSEHTGDARPNTLIHLYVDDIDDISGEFGIPVDEEGLAGRECALEDPDGNRLRVATRRT